jgi:enoyl-CoA hydratase/carnithine racemase
MNAISFQVQDELRAACAEATERDDVRAVVYGGERVFAAGNDVKEMARCRTPTWSRPAAASVRGDRDRPDPQAGRRGGHRLRARRWLRAGAVRRRPVRRGQRRPRPARDPARHHPRRRRHPAADASGRSQQGEGPHLHRPVRQGRRGARDRAGRPRRPADQVYAEALAWAAQFTGAAAWRSGRPRRASTAASRSTSRPGLEIERQQFAALFATEDRTIGMNSFMENGPGKAGSRR